MGWKMIDLGIPGQLKVSVKDRLYYLVGPKKIPGSTLDGYLYEIGEQYKQRQYYVHEKIIVASNGMYINARNI